MDFHTFGPLLVVLYTEFWLKICDMSYVLSCVPSHRSLSKHSMNPIGSTRLFRRD